MNSETAYIKKKMLVLMFDETFLVSDCWDLLSDMNDAKQ